MKNFLLFFLLIIFCGSVLNAQPGLQDASFVTNANDGPLYASAVDASGNVLIGGTITMYQGNTIGNIARLLPNGNFDNTFTTGTGFNGAVFSIVITPSGKILVGGSFTQYNGQVANRIIRLNSNGTIDATFSAGTGTDNTVRCITLTSSGQIYIGGDFNIYNGTSHRMIARLNSNGTIDATFNAVADASIYSMALQSNGQLWVGGSFTSVNGNGSFPKIARINANGTVDVMLHPSGNLNGTVYALCLNQAGQIVVGGAFTALGSYTTQNICRLNSDGSLDTGFNTSIGANAPVRAIAINQSGLVLIGGSFTTYNGAARSCITRLTTNAQNDANFNPGIGVTGGRICVYSIALQTDQKPILAGAFEQYNMNAKHHVVRLKNDINIVSQSTSTSICFNTGVALNVNAVSYGGCPLSYQWYKNNVIISGATAATYSVPASTAGATYTCKISGACGFVWINPIVITSIPVTVVNTTINNQSRCVGQATVLSISASGGGLSYQWKFNGSPIVGATSSFYYIPSVSLSHAGNYSCSVTGTCGSATSNTASLTVNTAPVITLQPLDYFLCFGKKDTLKVAATGTITGYQWYHSGVAISGATSNNYIINNAQVPDSGMYYCVVTGPCGSVNSNNAHITIITPAGTPGSVDPTFVTGTGLFGNLTQTIAMQPDGKYIVGGGFTSYQGNAVSRIVRINSDGSYDNTFNCVIDSTNYSMVYKVLVLPTGKILVAGNFVKVNGVYQRGIVRLNSDGSIDLTFNTGGIGIGIGANGSPNAIYDLALTSTGQIICVGSIGTYNGFPGSTAIRLNSNGTLDQSFNNTGGSPLGIIKRVEINVNGSMYFAGTTTMYDGHPIIGIVLVDQNGYFDASYNSFLANINDIYDIAIDNAGNLIAVGTFPPYGYGSIGPNGIMKMLPNGAPDPTFNAGVGLALNMPSPAFPMCVKIQNDNKILVGGFFYFYQGQTATRLVRINPDGSYDNTFVPQVYNGSVQDMYIQSNHKLMIVGSISVTGSPTVYGNIYRLNLVDCINSDGTFLRYSNTINNETSKIENELPFTGEIILYPNPANEQLTIYSSDEIHSIEIYNITGELILSNKPESNTTGFNTMELADGVYLVKVKTGAEIKTTRIVIQH